MSWPYPAAPNSSQMEYGVIQRLLDDAKQQLVQGNPQQALQVKRPAPYCLNTLFDTLFSGEITRGCLFLMQSVLALLSAMQLHGEVASAAFK